MNNSIDPHKYRMERVGRYTPAEKFNSPRGRSNPFSISRKKRPKQRPAKSERPLALIVAWSIRNAIAGTCRVIIERTLNRRRYAVILARMRAEWPFFFFTLCSGVCIFRGGGAELLRFPGTIDAVI